MKKDNKQNTYHLLNDVIGFLRSKNEIKFRVYYSECPLEYIFKGEYTSWRDFLHHQFDFLMRRDIYPYVYVRFVEE